MGAVEKKQKKAGGTQKTRVPKQKRSIEKKNKIMDAAMALFAQKGIHNTNSKEIAAMAGVSIGSFYSYFPNKKKLLIEVLGIYLNDHFDRIWNQSPSWDTFAPEELIRYCMENLLSAYNEAPDFHRETHVLRYSDPDVKSLYDKETEKELAQITSILAIHKDLITVRDLDAAAVVIHSAAENLAHKITFMQTLEEKRLVNEFAHMVFAYLSGQANGKAG